MIAACTRQQEKRHPRLSRWQTFAETQRIEVSTPGCLRSFAIAHQMMIVIRRAAPVADAETKERE